MTQHDQRQYAASSDTAVRQIELPADAAQRTTLPRLDYTDAFIVDTTGCRVLTAEQWARAMLDNSPPWFRRTAPWGWRGLGLERGPITSADSILSWPIKTRSDDELLLSGPGHFGMSAELLVQRRADGLLFSTMIELRTPFARAEWGAIAAPHRRIVTNLLHHARTSQLT